MPSLGIARVMEVAPTYIPCQRMTRHRFQAPFRRVRVFTERRLDFKQSSLCHITRVRPCTPSVPPPGHGHPACSCPVNLSASGKPADPETSLQVPPCCTGDTTRRHTAHYEAYSAAR